MSEELQEIKRKIKEILIGAMLIGGFGGKTEEELIKEGYLEKDFFDVLPIYLFYAVTADRTYFDKFWKWSMVMMPHWLFNYFLYSFFYKEPVLRYKATKDVFNEVFYTTEYHSTLQQMKLKKFQILKKENISNLETALKIDPSLPIAEQRAIKNRVIFEFMESHPSQEIRDLAKCEGVYLYMLEAGIYTNPNKPVTPEKYEMIKELIMELCDW